MHPIHVACGSCTKSWVRGRGLNDHERQSVESNPCPACGSYTLRCVEQVPAKRRFGTRAAGLLARLK